MFIYDSYKLELGVFMYKYFNGLLPMSFNTFFTKLSDIHNYDTRNKSNYIHLQQIIFIFNYLNYNHLQLEIERSLLTKQLELRDQSYGTL